MKISKVSGTGIHGVRGKAEGNGFVQPGEEESWRGGGVCVCVGWSV